MWWLPQTSGYSYPRVAAIWIDVHPAGENPTNTPRTLPTPVHARPAYTSYGQSPYVTIFHWLPRSRNRHLHPEEVLTTKDKLTQPSSWLASFFLPCDSPGVGERGFDPMVTQLHQLTRLILPTCDRYVQYLLTGPTHRSLTDTGRGYNLGGAILPHTHSPTFPTSCLHFPLMAPPSFHFNQVPVIKPKCWVLKNLWPPRGLSTTRPSTIAYIYA
jgi:hypothetical protein